MNNLLNKLGLSTKRIWLAVISLMFLGEVAILATHIDALLAAPVLFWVLAGIGTLRLARTISFNGVSDWFRHYFVREVVDTSGAGSNLEPKPGFWEALGELITCPICTGTHSAALILAVYALAPNIGFALAGILGVAGVSELAHWWAEKQEWQGREARENAGTQWLLKNKGAYIGAYVKDEDDKEYIKALDAYLLRGRE